MVIPSKQKKPVLKFKKRRRKVGNEPVFIVEKIVDFKYEASNRKLLFQVKWKGFSIQHNTYEPYENLEMNQVFQNYINQKANIFKDEMIIKYTKIIKKLKRGNQIDILTNQRKCITMHEIQPFDPAEFRVYQVCYHLLPNERRFNKTLEQLALKNYFFKLDEKQRQQNDQLLNYILKKEAVNLIIENEEDFGEPPNFIYIIENVPSIQVESESIYPFNVYEGCECEECTEESKCCSKLNKTKFPYKKTKSGRTVLRFSNPDIIYECGDSCKCSSKCICRLSQETSNVSLCLFKTRTRGWGIKAERPIPKATYIFCYAGELINQEEAAKLEFAHYMFDLGDSKSSEKFYTVDAAIFGNLSRFVNHSCKPNTVIWKISQCDGDPKNQKVG